MIASVVFGLYALGAFAFAAHFWQRSGLNVVTQEAREDLVLAGAAAAIGLVAGCLAVSYG